MNYTHLTQAERYQIAILNKAGHEQSEIARGLKSRAAKSSGAAWVAESAKSACSGDQVGCAMSEVR